MNSGKAFERGTQLRVAAQPNKVLLQTARGLRFVTLAGLADLASV